MTKREDATAAARREVGSLVRQLRGIHQFSQEQLTSLSHGKTMRLSRAAISGIERGRHLPSLEALLVLWRDLHLDPMDIVERVKWAVLDREELSHRSVEQLVAHGIRTFNEGEYWSALVTYDRARDAAILGGPTDRQEKRRMLARIELFRAAAMRRCGNHGIAKATAEEAILLSDESPEIHSQAYGLLASLFSRMGNRSLALRNAEWSVECSKGLSDEIRGRAILSLGVALDQDRRFQESLAAYVTARDLLESAGDKGNLARTVVNMGHCLTRLKKYREARKCLTEGILLSRKLSRPSIEAMGLVNLGETFLFSGGLDGAERWAGEAAKLASMHKILEVQFAAERVLYRADMKRDPSIGTARVPRLRMLASRLSFYRGLEGVSEFAHH